MMDQKQSREPTPDEVVIQIRELREKYGAPYPVLAALFNISPHTVPRICRYERRAFVRVKA